MKKNSVKSLKLSKKTISKLNNRETKGQAIIGGFSEYPCIDDIGKGSFHCGSLAGCDSAQCITEFWTESDCASLIGTCDQFIG